MLAFLSVSREALGSSWFRHNTWGHCSHHVVWKEGVTSRGWKHQAGPGWTWRKEDSRTLHSLRSYMWTGSKWTWNGNILRDSTGRKNKNLTALFWLGQRSPCHHIYKDSSGAFFFFLFFQNVLFGLYKRCICEVDVNVFLLALHLVHPSDFCSELEPRHVCPMKESLEGGAFAGPNAFLGLFLPLSVWNESDGFVEPYISHIQFCRFTVQHNTKCKKNKKPRINVWL